MGWVRLMAKSKRRVREGDALQAIDIVMVGLRRNDPEAVRRVMRWAEDKFGDRPPRGHVEP